MAIQNRNTTLPGIWAENAQTTIPTPPVAGVTYRDTTLNSTAIDEAWPFKTIVDSSDFNQHAFLQDTLIKEAEQYGVMRWNNTTTYKEGGFCLGQDGKLYQALRDNQGKEPTANADDWKVFTSGGGFPIGSIGYTLRTEVPEGGAWCDGEEYTQAMFPDIYQMLVDGKIQSTTYQNFTSSVSTNGSCGFFALDSSAQKFKVPLLTNVYLKAGQAPSMFGAESLPNFDAYIFAGDNGTGLNEDIGMTPSMTKNSASGAAEVVTNTKNRGYSAVGLNATKTKGFRISPSLSSSTYQDSAKVNPDHVVYRAYVVLYASAAEASVAQAAEFMTALDGKANTDLSNVSSNIDYIVESKVNSDGSWYRKYKSGWLEQGGVDLTVNVDSTKTVTLIKPFKNTKYIVNWLDQDGSMLNGAGTRGISNKTTTSFVASNGQDKKMNIGWIAIGQGA